MTLRERIANALFGNTIETLVQQRISAVSIGVDDSPGWESLTKAGPADRPWADVYADLEETLEAWRKNFFIRRLVTLTRTYVVAGGIQISSDVPDVQAFLDTFWTHRQNRMDQRLGPICDELTRAGEIFPILFTNKVDGMSYVRFVPASRIREIETDPDDYEIELRYAQTRDLTAEPKWWIGPGHRHAFQTRYNKLEPLMLHFAVNKPVGATRGESDLLPILPWAKRYAEWLKDRVRLNRIRTRQAIMHLKIADPALVEQKRQQLRTDNPIESGIYVSGPDEEIIIDKLAIQAGDAQDDGRALRLAIACGGNVGLHYMGEGESVNYATAKEMGEPTARFFADRQADLAAALTQIVASAYRRYCAITGTDWPGRESLGLSYLATEVARADNESLALAARNSVQAFALMRANGWIDDQTAVRLALKFAGEPLGDEQVLSILAKAPEPQPYDPSLLKESAKKDGKKWPSHTTVRPPNPSPPGAPSTSPASRTSPLPHPPTPASSPTTGSTTAETPTTRAAIPPAPCTCTKAASTPPGAPPREPAPARTPPPPSKATCRPTAAPSASTTTKTPKPPTTDH